jgi:hypothetical protein
MKKGRVKLLAAQILSMINTGNVKYSMALQQEKNDLLTNGKRIPYPSRFLNQRQKRKLFRQTQ